MKTTLLIFTLLLLATTLHANDKLSRLEAVLHSERNHSRFWQYGWTGFFMADMGAKVLIISSSDKEEKKYDAKVELIKSSIATVAMFAKPMNVHTLGNELKKNPSKYDRQRMMIQAIEREQRERSWKAHAGSVALNMAGSLFIWLDDNREDDALIKFALGMMVGELKTFTSPTKTWKAYENIKDKNFLNEVSIRPIWNGLSVAYSF